MIMSSVYGNSSLYGSYGCRGQEEARKQVEREAEREPGKKHYTNTHNCNSWWQWDKLVLSNVLPDSRPRPGEIYDLISGPAVFRTDGKE